MSSASQKIGFLFTLFTCIGIAFSVPAGISSDLAVLRLCNASSPVSLETVNSVLIHRDLQNSEARSEAFKCFLLCLYTEYGWMDHDGGFELHTIKSALLATHLSPQRIKLLLYRCTSTESEIPCDRASTFTECFWSHTGNELEDEPVQAAMK